ncbi:universal stress protein [Paenibacillus phoenicis]|uniref:Universal stress protein n=1 Tax=Paenibacillus phoenicis TaxID=554117 RepID=A0ABU5PRG2_9BACL|nr:MULTISPECIES: universal stress protein [Paenibacillus]EES73497.1 universal stress family protein [Paenibacillus sp. oral taxon 786 str. D14]MCT2195279.1 universal stress protein [Paenibacillus sp. p3-SID1389]MEA3572528.1 universal stress protein [Paenibacillus phoenicis]
MLFHKILAAYDGSKAANKALDKAIELCKTTPEAKLEVLHVYDFPRFYVAEGFVPVPASMNKDFYELAERTVEEAKKRVVAAGLEPKVEMVQGAPAETILEYAQKSGADLIVIGSRGLGGIREFVLGSVSHNVVQHARIPVLVVK